MDFPDGAVIFEPQETFNKAIIGVEGNRLVYCFDKIVDSLMENGLSYIDAVDYISFNIGPQGVKNWPIIQEENIQEEQE